MLSRMKNFFPYLPHSIPLIMIVVVVVPTVGFSFVGVSAAVLTIYLFENMIQLLSNMKIKKNTVTSVI